jgi:hypothetical protein
MNTEELVSRLENVDLPNIELESHRQHLKQALLEAYNLPSHHVDTTKPLGNKIHLLITRSLYGLTSHKPVWKTLIISSVVWIVIASTIAFIVFTPVSNTGTNMVMAAGLVLNDPLVKAMLPKDGTTIVTASDIGNHEAEIFIQNPGAFITVELETRGTLKIEKITHITIFPPAADGNSLTIEEKERALNVAKTDIQVQILLNTGASINRVDAVNCNVVVNNIETGKITNTDQMYAYVILDIGNQQHGFLIDLKNGSVVNK